MSEIVENPKLKSIYELLCNEEGKPESFFIPSYQRGYRWTEQQVKELLEDIWEFAQDVESNKNSGFYCLQPIVIKKSKEVDFTWDVIDGQQRLTTIYILLKYFEQQTKTKPYKIGYETRKNSQEFLKNIDNVPNENNIDFFHMSKTFATIEKWFEDKDFANINLFLTRLLQKPNIENNNIDKAKNIRVIWYEIDDTKVVNEDNKYKNDIEIFTRINMGKIPLTNAELIKALLIQGYGNNDNKNNKQFELASEWDFIEYSLQNDDFWYFINKEKNEKATRIEFIFELIAKNYLKVVEENFAKEIEKHKSIDRYYEFHIINHYLQNDTRDEDEKKKETIYEKLWKEVKNYFRILNEWYEDREFFHKIGFLIIYSKKTMFDLIDEYTKENSTKKEFRDFLDDQIKEIFKNIEIEDLNYEKDGESIRKVLLMFNINTIIENRESNLRFQFDRYKKQNWDIEHIRSQADKYPKSDKEKEEWVDDILKLPNIEKTKDIILKMDKKEFNEFFDDIQNKIEGEDNDFNKHSIGNLTLLDNATNRGYGNAFFPIKRKTIIENDKNGTFIPICTKNLFLKYYSENANDLQKWTKQDAEDYKNTILKTFKEIFKNEVQNAE
ncbi:DUF262 domain-containing protein [Aliarcobacter cryaerophilus]|uniref:GmrSD restriction endonucleases N-terminal domain-containing protein n=1 Tax=Aliarcobacter cryaerophilus TaxID=28198 RepID=A0A2S9T5T4_9BACT|nr:DUF262 domain-containing protein [Aliarcobacter cryaerophilus]PRM94203.1 hypothetical protein CJ670_10680 [Arcobacter cryaerophilus gv. crypticus]